MKKYFDITSEVFVAYFKGQIKVAAILAVLYSIALYIIGVKYGIAIGIFTGIFSIIPYFGFIFGIVVSSIVAAIQFRDFYHVLYVFLAFGLIQVLESFVISPKILGSSVGINPIVAMVLLIVGGAAFGFIGLIFTIPISVAIYRIYIVRRREQLEKDINQNDINLID